MYQSSLSGVSEDDEDALHAKLLPSGEMKNKEYKLKGLHFRLTVYNGSKKTSCERRFKDFEYLRQALTKVFPGCYVPRLVTGDIGSTASQLNLSSDLPSGYLERRKELNLCRSVESFCEKLKECMYLLESGKYWSSHCNPNPSSLL